MFIAVETGSKVKISDTDNVTSLLKVIIAPVTSVIKVSEGIPEAIALLPTDTTPVTLDIETELALSTVLTTAEPLLRLKFDFSDTNTL